MTDHAQGAICLDILKDAWSPVRLLSRRATVYTETPQVLTLKSTLISLQSLLCEPVPNDPQDAEGELPHGAPGPCSLPALEGHGID